MKLLYFQGHHSGSFGPHIWFGRGFGALVSWMQPSCSYPDLGPALSVNSSAAGIAPCLGIKLGLHE